MMIRVSIRRLRADTRIGEDLSLGRVETLYTGSIPIRSRRQGHRSPTVVMWWEMGQVLLNLMLIEGPPSPRDARSSGGGGGLWSGRSAHSPEVGGRGVQVIRR